MLTLRVPDSISARLIGSSLITAVAVPPKDPRDDDDENGEDEEDDNDNEEDEEPAVIREPDEC
jgi:hypothetical protein